MQVTLDEIVTNWLIHNKLDHIFNITEIDLYGIDNKSYKLLAFKDGIYPSFIGLIKGNEVTWLSDICDPYDWPTCWTPIVKPLNAYNIKFFEELEEVLTKSYQKHKNDIFQYNDRLAK